MARLIESLGAALLPVFRRLGVTKETVTGPLEHTDLVWQTPPMTSELMLGKFPVWELFDVALQVQEEAFYAFYSNVMEHLHNKPEKVCDLSGYKNLSVAMRYTKTDERRYWLSVPEGFPREMTPYAGAIFSLECAHILKLAGLAVEFTETESDYYAITANGYEVGVREGFPILGEESWDVSIEGMVPEFLSLPRGNTFEGCDYDLVSKLRSTLWEHKAECPEFEAADLLLQALRVLANGNRLKGLQSGLLDSRKQAAHSVKATAYKEAIDLAAAPALSDRQKINALRSLLVPCCINISKFSKSIYDYGRDPPAMLSRGQMARVQQNLQTMLDNEEASYRAG